MWQAKYFTSSLSTTQWEQIEKSIKTAIDSHPMLFKYYVCLPLDRPDAKVKNQKSMLEKWEIKRNEWKVYSRTILGKEIEITYWGNFELVKKLSKKEHEGLKYFWFNQEEFLDDWFDYKNQESICALGARYSKELNFELPIAKIFDGLSRDKDFEKQHHSEYSKLLECYRKACVTVDNKNITTLIRDLYENLKEFRKIYESIIFIGNNQIPYGKLISLLEILSTKCSSIEEQLEKLRETQENKKETDYYNRPYNKELSGVREFRYIIEKLQSFYNETICCLSNNPFLMIWGEAGCGKSHLLADIINKRKEKGQQSLFILGEHFTTKELPWTQVLRNILRKQNVDELIFLGALNAKATINQEKIIIFIDALNEGEGRYIWPNRLKAFINSIRKYPWLGLVISIRDSYIKLIAPKEEINSSLIQKYQHEGFANNEYKAVKLFFKHYNIILPSTPLLNPEFQNPLFLKLYCLSLSEQGLHEVPSGYEGITSIIDTFLCSVNYKLSKPNNLDFDENINLVKQAVDSIVLYMINNNCNYVPYIEANKITSEIFKNECCNNEPYLKRLISEGVFNINLFWDKKGKHFDVIYLAYQRFQDHLTVALLLEKFLNIEDPESSFKSGQLHEIIKEPQSLHYNQNLIEALSIQLPERVNKELFEVVSDVKLYYIIAKAFIQSLIWRKVETISENVSSYINDVILQDDNLFDYFFEVILSISMKEEFYFNAEKTHSYLTQFSLAERDYLWTIWLQDKYDKEKRYHISSVQRLIDWAWGEEELSYLSDNSILLTSITLSWFLVSTNRYLRDAATKALVCILRDRIHLLVSLLDNFKNVNDPYILERLYAISYGVVLRSKNRDEIKTLSEYIYNEVFEKKIVYPHILLRDYARGIIEYALFLEINSNIDTSKIRPPYKSEKLPSRFPSNKTIDKKYEPLGDTGNYQGECWGATAILRSMATEYGRSTGGYGDFGRYVFQRALDGWKVDYDGLSNYAIQRIFEIGYDPKIFTEFDMKQGTGRKGGHNERIGKKYQWIIFYELLARVSDQCLLIDESDWNSPKSTILFDGPWYPYVRDIDPTIIIKEKKSDKYRKYPSQWRFNSELDLGVSSQKEWLKTRNDIPKPETIIETTDPSGEAWVWLEIHPSWDENIPIGEDKYNVSYKHLWMQVQSYLIKKNDVNKLKTNFNNIDEFPETRSLYQIFSREYYWSPAFRFFNKPYYCGEDWVEITKNRRKNKIMTVHRTTEFFNWEEEIDCSKEIAMQYYYPTQILKDGLNLRYSSNDGEFINDGGEIICLDPSVNNKSIAGVLIKKKPFLEWLDKNDLVVIWNVYGEKQIIGNYSRDREHLGRLNMFGLYILEKNGEVKGGLNFEEE